MRPYHRFDFGQFDQHEPWHNDVIASNGDAGVASVSSN
jgi:hypothetical protein